MLNRIVVMQVNKCQYFVKCKKEVFIAYKKIDYITIPASILTNIWEMLPIDERTQRVR